MFNDDSEWDLAILSYIHDRIIDASGGSKGFHDEGLVKSALARPMHTAMGEDIMLRVVNNKPSIEEIKEWLKQHVVIQS